MDRWTRVRERLLRLQAQERSARQKRAPADAAARFVVTRAELADLLDVVVRTVNKMAARGDLPARTDAGHWDLGAVLRHLRDRAAKAPLGASEPDAYTAVRTKIWTLRLAREKGEVVALDDMRRVLAPALIAFRDGLNALPDRLAMMAPEGIREEIRADARAAADGLLKDLEDAVRGGSRHNGAA